MGGFMWALRWVAAGTIFATCIAMTVEAELECRSFKLAQYKPLVAHDQVIWVHR